MGWGKKKKVLKFGRRKKTAFPKLFSQAIFFLLTVGKAWERLFFPSLPPPRWKWGWGGDWRKKCAIEMQTVPTPSSFPRGKKPLLFFLSFSRGIFSLPTPTFCTSRNLFCRGLGKSFYCVLVPIHSITRKRGPSHGNANFFSGKQNSITEEGKVLLFWGPPPLCHHKTQICQTVKIAYSTHVESEAEKVFRSILEKVLVAIFGKAVIWCLHVVFH